MKKDPKLTQTEAQAAVRVGKELAEGRGVFDLTEGDILEVLFWASVATGLEKRKFNAFRLNVYRTILEYKPDYCARLTEAFRKELAAVED